MSDKVTSEDIMASLAALRKDVKRLLESHDDHERRLSAVEPIRGQVRNMAEHVGEIGRKVTVIYELLEGSERQVADALRAASQQLSSDMTAAVRAELGGLRGDLKALTESLNTRPCLVGEDCPGGHDR